MGESRWARYRLGYVGVLEVLVRLDEDEDSWKSVDIRLRRNAARVDSPRRRMTIAPSNSLISPRGLSHGRRRCRTSEAETAAPKVAQQKMLIAQVAIPLPENLRHHQPLGPVK